MCGICGIINLRTQPAEGWLLQPMMKAMKHRGPDDEGTFEEGSAALGFVRLSIIDLSSAGHQPMLSDDGNLVLIFNGEIYNYIEIRDELVKRGHRFKTRTDTEVLLHAYQEWGEGCQERFNGMWAFAIYDRKEKRLFASRDRYGVKPFYYYLDEERFVFASEIPPILCSLPGKPNPDYQSIFDFVVFNRTDQNEYTFFEGIKKLQHGHCLTIENNAIKIRKWYDLRSKLNKPFRNADEFRETLSSSIGVRLRSDVPVGVSLSGGIDSSSIASVILHTYGRSDLKTFSAVYEKGQHGDESEYIAEFRTLLKNMYYTTPTADSLMCDIRKFVQAHAEPIPSTSPYAQFKVMELAKGNVVVTLDGQGADEQLAGYHYFFGMYFKDLFLHGRLPTLTKEITYYLRNHSSLFGIKTFAYFLLPRFLRTSARISEKGYIKECFTKKYENGDGISGKLYASTSLQEALVDHFEYKLEHLMKWNDRNSMRFSLEAREPFLDYRLVEGTLSMASQEIIRNGTTKHVLREAMKGLVPEKIRTRRDKIGFENPQAEWFRTKPFQKLVSEILDSKSFITQHIVQPAKAKSLYGYHLKKKVNCSKEIWKWIHLEMWFREFIASITQIVGDIMVKTSVLVEI